MRKDQLFRVARLEHWRDPAEEGDILVVGSNDKHEDLMEKGGD